MTVMAQETTTLSKKTPALEAIFEMRWELAQIPNTQVYRDPSYPLLYGRLYDRFKKAFPLTEDLPATQLHADANPYVVRHRLRKTQGAFPLVQVGPGILTVHEGKDYIWKSYRDEIVGMFEAFVDFYPKATFPLKLIKMELRFIHGVEMQEGEDPMVFAKERLDTKVELPKGLFVKGRVPKKTEGLSVTVGLELEHPAGHAMLALGSGNMDQRSALIQQMAFQSSLEETPQDVNGLKPWLDSMYALAEQWSSALHRDEG